MKLLFTLLLCLLLAGCSAPEETPPEETVPVSPDTETVLQHYGGNVKAVPLQPVQQLLPAGDGFLLHSGDRLTLLDGDFRPTASCAVEAQWQAAVCNGQITLFHPDTRQLRILDGSLEELRTLTLPVELTGSPVLGENTLFYCTETGIYRWDLDSGIRRRIRQSAYPSQTLVDIHWEQRVLQCRITENGRERDLFLDCDSGELLKELEVTARLTTFRNRYYCVFSSGAVENLIFGTDPEVPQCLFPGILSADGVFLPQSHSAILVEEDRLSCYDLETGRLRDTLTLHHRPEAILERRDSVYLLVRHQEQNFLLQWQPGGVPSSGKAYTSPWYTADSPDPEGLALCRDYAAQLSETYGLEVLIWKEAAGVTPWDYTFQPEYRYPVLLSQLQTLEACLSRYPREILSQTAAHFDSLKLCLVQSVTGTAGGESLSAATGVQFLNNRDAHVVLAAGPYQEQALYHELFHAMETHILSRSNALDRWNELNPAGFSYDLDHATNARRNSGVYLESGSRAFVDTYSMSFPREDRARIFEYAMLPDCAHLFRSEIMQRKLAAICTGIREAYGLKQSEDIFPWEQYLS